MTAHHFTQSKTLQAQQPNRTILYVLCYGNLGAESLGIFKQFEARKQRIAIQWLL